MTAPKPGTRIVNRGRGHSYLLDGAKVPGVTTILGDGFPKPGLINWAASTTAAHAVNNWDELAELPIAERLRRLERARWDDVTSAGERGTEVHTLGLRYILGEPVVPPDELAGHFESYKRFVDEWVAPDVDPISEAAVFSREYRYGGRFDFLGPLVDGHVWLLDFKTSRSGVFKDMALQLAAYRYAEFYVLDGQVDETGAAIEHPMPRVDRTGIVHLRADGYDLYALEGGPDAFAVFGAIQQVAEFATSGNDEWIGESLRPPALAEPGGVSEREAVELLAVLRDAEPAFGPVADTLLALANDESVAPEVYDRVCDAVFTVLNEWAKVRRVALELLEEPAHVTSPRQSLFPSFKGSRLWWYLRLRRAYRLHGVTGYGHRKTWGEAGFSAPVPA